MGCELRQIYSGRCHVIARLGERAVQVNRATKIGADSDLEPEFGGIKGGISHAEIGREADEGQVVIPTLCKAPSSPVGVVWSFSKKAL